MKKRSLIALVFLMASSAFAQSPETVGLLPNKSVFALGDILKKCGDEQVDGLAGQAARKADERWEMLQSGKNFDLRPAIWTFSPAENKVTVENAVLVTAGELNINARFRQELNVTTGAAKITNIFVRYGNFTHAFSEVKSTGLRFAYEAASTDDYYVTPEARKSLNSDIVEKNYWVSKVDLIAAIPTGDIPLQSQNSSVSTFTFNIADYEKCIRSRLTW